MLCIALHIMALHVIRSSLFRICRFHETADCCMTHGGHGLISKTHIDLYIVT